MNENLLYAVYDLNASPASYDFATFCVVAEAHRVSKGFRGLHFLIVPVTLDLGHYDHKLYGADHTAWRINEIVLPMCSFLPSYAGVTLAASREDAATRLAALAPESIFPSGSTIKDPVTRHHTAWVMITGNQGHDLQTMRASAQAGIYARQWIETNCGGRPCVPITLREAPFLKMRNSDPAIWGEFASRLSAAGYAPVLLRDIDTALAPPEPAFAGIPSFAEGVFNLDLRLALYEAAHIATFVTNGPVTPCWYDRNVRFLCVLTGEWLENKPPPFEQFGMKFGVEPPFFNRYQEFIWEKQNADVMMAAFTAMSKRIDADRAAGTYDDGPRVENRIPMSELAARFRKWAGNAYYVSPDYTHFVDACYEDSPLDETYEDEMLNRMYTRALAAHEYEKVLSILEMRGQRFGYNGELYVQIGVFNEALSRIDAALAALENAVRLGHNPPAVIFRLGVVSRQAKKMRQARTCFETLLNANAAYPELFKELGALYEETGEIAKAVELYRRAQALKVEAPELEARLAALSRQAS